MKRNQIIAIYTVIVSLYCCKPQTNDTKGVDVDLVQQEHVTSIPITYWKTINNLTQQIKDGIANNKIEDYSKCSYTLNISEVKIDSLKNKVDNTDNYIFDSQFVATLSSDRINCIHDQIMTKNVSFQRNSINALSTPINIIEASAGEFEELKKNATKAPCDLNHEIVLIKGYSHPIKIDIIACRQKVNAANTNQKIDNIIGGIIQLDNNLVNIPHSLVGQKDTSYIWFLEMKSQN